MYSNKNKIDIIKASTLKKKRLLATRSGLGRRYVIISLGIILQINTTLKNCSKFNKILNIKKTFKIPIT